jgi:glucose/arabinose dehydrogenase
MATLLDHVDDDDEAMTPASMAPASPAAVGRPVTPSRRSRWMTIAVWIAVAGLATSAGVLMLRGKGYGQWARRQLGLASAKLAPPLVVGTRPAHGSANVHAGEPIVVRLMLPNGALSAGTVTPSSVTLVRASDNEPVDAALSIEPASDGVTTITLRPTRPLEGATRYKVTVTSAVKDGAGVAMVPHTAVFTTGSTADPEIRFTKVPLPTAQGLGAGFTCVQFGPDGQLWAATDDGRILRFAIAADGALEKPVVYSTLQRHAGGNRLVTGFAFDPTAPKDQPVLWVTHGWYGFADAPDLSGRVSRLSGPGLETVTDVITGLPRSIRDHLTNQPSFGPDGALYIPQASNSAFGSPDPEWGMRAERRLNATILRLDVAKWDGSKPIDVRTKDVGGTYDPAADGAPLTVYADGVRLAYDLVWHSNGSLYAPVNGSSPGGNAPAGNGAPALNAIPTSEHDWFFRITPGRYYGHPNPTAGYFVLNGGNPTAGHDPAEVVEYPVGVKPERNWKPAEFDFGNHVSPNGAVEYRHAGFSGKMKGKIIVCRYNGGSDLICLDLDERGEVRAAHVGIPGFMDLANPLDVTEDPRNGNLYVSEYGKQQITLIRPASAP